MKIEWQFSGKKKTDHKHVIQSFKPSEFDSPSRSTVPFLEQWRYPKKCFKAFSDAFDIEFNDNVVLDFEHKVPVQKGRGIPSHTDLAILNSLNKELELKIGIEAKFTEGRYDSCEKWLRSEKNEENRVKVLEGWLSLLNSISETAILLDDVKDVPYQMIHRAASVCYGDAKIKVLIYHVFNPGEKRQIYLNDLGKLREALGSKADIKIAYLESEFIPSEVWKDLNNQWQSGKRKLSEGVIKALSKEGLGSTEMVKIRQI